MAEIKVTPSVLRTQASNFNQINSKFKTLMNTIKNDMNAMKNNWESQAADSFINRFNQIQRNIEGYSQVIAEYAQFLNFSAEEYEGADNRVGRQNDGIVNNLFS